jgi:hypothetical protein
MIVGVKQIDLSRTEDTEDTEETKRLAERVLGVRLLLDFLVKHDVKPVGLFP